MLLVGLQVPVASVVDFDVFNDEQPLRRIVEAHGGRWDTVKTEWEALKAAVENKAAFVGGDTFRANMQTFLEETPKGPPFLNNIEQSKKLARNASPWDNAKDLGIGAIPAGAPNVAAQSMLATLQTIDIFAVSVGAVEGFCRSIR